MPRFVYWMLPLISKNLRQMAFGQGMGRHTEAEVYEMGIKDLRAISVHLGNNPFFTGDKVTELDCAMFGMLAQLLWNCPGSPFEQLMNGTIELRFYSIFVITTYLLPYFYFCAQVNFPI